MAILKANSTFCKYDVVKSNLTAHSLQPTEEDDWNLMWIDTAVSLERVLLLKSHQMINHFPGMIELCRKDFLARNVLRAQKILPDQYNFFPKTWILPLDLASLEYHMKRRNTTYICKPDNGCQGSGIFLFKTIEQFSLQKTSLKTKFVDAFVKHDCVVQEYKDAPILLNGKKFDLRIYVMVKSFDPLIVYVYDEGLVRLATVPYKTPNKSNMGDLCMHLTNYAITKDSANFVMDETGESGSKRSLSSLWRTLESSGVDAKLLWSSICKCIVKTILIIQPDIKHVMTTIDNPVGLESKCFEVLGFDVMVDKNMKPWVIEVNHSPSFACETNLDSEIKMGLIDDTLKLLQPDFKKLGQSKQKDDSENKYSKIYPSSDKHQQDVYEQCLLKIQEQNRGNRAEVERKKWIMKKLETVEKSKEMIRVWKEKHDEKTKVMASLHELRPVAVKIVEKRVEKQFLGKVPLKLSVTDLSFGL